MPFLDKTPHILGAKSGLRLILFTFKADRVQKM